MVCTVHTWIITLARYASPGLPAVPAGHLRRTSVQVWTHPDVALVPHDKCGIGQDVSILAERKGMVPTWYPEWGALCPGWGAVHEPWYGFKKRVSPMTKL
jgi:hypothetical protein